MSTVHPVTLYGFITGLVALIGVIVLTALSDIPVEAALPIISGIGLGGVGVAGGVAIPRAATVDTGTVTNADPNG